MCFFFFGKITFFFTKVCFYLKGAGVVFYFLFSCSSKHDFILLLAATLMRILYPKYVYESNFIFYCYHYFDINFVSAMYIPQIVYIYTHVDYLFCFCLTNSDERGLLLMCLITVFDEQLRVYSSLHLKTGIWCQ